MNTTPVTTAIQPMTDDERAGYIRLLEAIKVNDPTISAYHRKLAQAVLMIVKVEKLSPLSQKILKAVAKEIAPEIFDDK